MGRYRNRTTRRVTAQRKFAQGAFVPPVVAAPPSNNATITNTERRDAPTTSSDRNNIFHSNMSAKNLLDIVCFQSSHTHMQPIVLVERLRGENLRQDTEQTQVEPVPGPSGLCAVVIPKPKVNKPRKVIKTKQHLMTLRTREERNAPKWMATTSTWGTGRKPTRQDHRRPPPKKHVHKKTRTKRRRRLSSESSLEDNRPLKYFANSSTPRTPQATTDTLMGPPLLIPRYLSVPPSLAIAPPSPVSDRSAFVAIDRGASTTPSSGVFRNTKIDNIASVTERYFNELNAPSCSRTPAHEQPSTPDAFEAEGSVVSYYSEQGIHRWIDGAMPEERATTPRPQQDTIQQPTNSDDEEVRPESVPPYSCAAETWKSVADVIAAPKSAYNSRCTLCASCQRIEKVIKLTILLKRQRQIDCLPDDVDKNQTDQGPSREKDSNGDWSNSNVCLSSELLPKHPHLMIKMTVATVNTQTQFFACLIARSEGELLQTFLMSEHSYILDQVIETLSLNLGDPPSSLVGTSASTSQPPGFRDKSAAFDMPSCSTSAGKPLEEDNGSILEAPTFWITEDDFKKDPIAFIEKIWDEVSQYGICKIAAPSSFVPACKVDDDMRFEVTNQYISRLYNRWGPAAREMCAIKACLKAQNISFQRPPLLEGIEVNLPKLYHLVQRHGGLENVINKKKWGKVAEDLKLHRNPLVERKLDAIYFKYLLPYDTLSADERQEFLRKVEKAWNRKNRKLLDRANNPLHRVRRLLDESESSSEETEIDYTQDAEDCIKSGVQINLAKFKKVANTAFDNFFRNQAVHTQQIEEEYWRRVTSGTEHVCVNSSSIDTSEQGLGFTRNKNDNYGKHPWNLKVISGSTSNVLRALNPTLGLTAPILHLGMVFSTNCWHRDPHSVAWIEYAHQGAAKIWYGIPEQQDRNFRGGTETLNPTACQNKSLWLSSDITMIPPNLLREHSVKVYRVQQAPGEYVLVMPRAYSCSISTGFNVSESIYIATETYLDNLLPVFKEIRQSCEPTMFALEKLLKNIAEDPLSKPSALRKIQTALEVVFEQELANRELLIEQGIRLINDNDVRTSDPKGKRPRQPSPPSVWSSGNLECEVCRCTLYLSLVKHIPSKAKNSCLQHALELLTKAKYAHIQKSDLELHCAFTSDQLKKTIKNLRRRLQQ